MSRSARWRQLRKSSRTWDSPWIPAGGGLLAGTLLPLALGAPGAGRATFAFLFGFLVVALPVLVAQKATTRALRELRALINVRPMAGSQLLSRNTWAMDAVYAENVLALVDEGAESILELGSGRSTVLIAERLAERGAGHLFAVDHLDTFADETRALLRERGLEARATVVHAPVTDVTVDGRTLRWYDPAAIQAGLAEAGAGRIDLLLVDGPPGTLERDARWPAVPVLIDHLSEDAVILMDDADRAAETRAASDWHQRLGGELRYLSGGRGGWLLRRRP